MVMQNKCTKSPVVRNTKRCVQREVLVHLSSSVPLCEKRVWVMAVSVRMEECLLPGLKR